MTDERINNYPAEKIIEERNKCMASAGYFINTYGSIFDELSGGVVPYKLFRNYKIADKTSQSFDEVCGQLKILAAFVKYALIATLKGRQIGISWLAAHYCLWVMVFNKQKRVFVVSKDEDTAGEFIDKVLTAFDNLPTWLKPAVYQRREKKLLRFAKKENIKGTKEWQLGGHNSYIEAFPSVSEVLRSKTPSILVLDEFAFIPFLGRKMTAMLGSRSTSLAKIIAISTANGTAGTGKIFHQMCTHSVQDRGQYRQFHFEFAGWQTDPRRDGNWYHDQKEIMGDDFRQEHPSTPEEAFVVSGDCFFDAELLTQRIQELVDKPSVLEIGSLAYHKDLKTSEEEFKFIESPNGELTISKHPIAGRSYTIGADPTEGGPRADNGVAYVMDDKTGEYVAELISREDPDVFADALATLGRYYNMAFIGVEANKGDAVNRWLVDPLHCNYPYVYMRETVDTLDPKSSDKLGWFSTNPTKRWIYDNYKIHWRLNETPIPFINLLYEMQNILLDRKSEGRALSRIGAAGRNPDDRPDAAAITLEMHKVRPEILEENRNVLEIRRRRGIAEKEVAALIDKGVMATYYQRRRKKPEEESDERYIM